MIDALRLQVGMAYYMPTYPEPTLATPIILTYVYLGVDLDLLLNGVPVPSGSPGLEATQRPSYYFRFMPPFRYNFEPQARDAWQGAFPDLFRGWGESAPSVFNPDQLTGLMTLGELIEELQRIAGRLRA